MDQQLPRAPQQKLPTIFGKSKPVARSPQRKSSNLFSSEQ